MAALAAAPAAAKAPRHAAHRHAAPHRPVVVELYTAEGCADCPGANELLMKLADKPDIIALTFPVDYWDYLGWRDTFAKPEFTERQRAYMKAMKLRDVYTPQVVVDGEAQMAGLKSEEVDAAIDRAAHESAPRPDIAPLGRAQVQVGTGRLSGAAVVWLARYSPDVHEITVRAGENKGRTIRETNVVRDLIKLGPWRGTPHIYRLPKSDGAKLKSVILVQSVKTGRILAARRL